ncbi:MAG: hypothetical protein QXL15_01700 [Candidatus Korarchaeota archaeon]
MSEEAVKRVKCPKCGSLNVAEEDDKHAEPIGYVAHVPIYPKRYRCRMCGTTWK